MTLNNRIEAGKPYVTGFIAGLIAAPIVAFSAGWVSTSGARAEAVENARVDTLVRICSSNVERTAAAESIELATLKGYGNRERRDEMVTAALTGLNVAEDLAKRVSRECGRSFS